MEALISFVLFLLASLSFYGLLANSRTAETNARQTTAATAYARQLMESATRKGYASLTVGAQTGKRTLTTSRQGVSGQTVFSSVVTVYSGPGSDTKSILVTVSWNKGKIEMETYVTP